MTGQTLTARERHTLDHLRRAEEVGAALPNYATAFNLNLEHLLSGKAQLESKGLWPIRPKAPEPARTELLAVQVLPDTPANALQSKASETLVCRLTAPNGWVLECDRWPQAQWLAALMGTERGGA